MPTFIGKPVTVAEDKQLQVGDILRDFNLTATDLSQKTLSEFFFLIFYPFFFYFLQFLFLL